jgi:hypothetical protein
MRPDPVSKRDWPLRGSLDPNRAQASAPRHADAPLVGPRLSFVISLRATGLLQRRCAGLPACGHSGMDAEPQV